MDLNKKYGRSARSPDRKLPMKHSPSAYLPDTLIDLLCQVQPSVAQSHKYLYSSPSMGKPYDTYLGKIISDKSVTDILKSIKWSKTL